MRSRTRVRSGIMPDIRLLMTADAAGGIWTYALGMKQALSARGVSTILAILGDRPSELALRAARAIGGVEIELADLPLDWTATSASEMAHAGEEIARLARRVDADLVQLNAPAFAASASFPVPMIGALHSCVATWWEAVHGNVPLPQDLEWRGKLTRPGRPPVAAAIPPSQARAPRAQRLYAFARAPNLFHNRTAAPDRRRPRRR